jgi:amino acid adenylation domain-containing protein
MVLYEWNNTRVGFPRDKTLHTLIAEQAERRPTNIAVSFKDKRLTYAELEEKSNQLAHYLINLGIEVESLVGLYVERSIEMVIAILGILKSGAAYVPIDPDLPAARIKLMMEDAKPRVILTQENLSANLNSEANTIVSLDKDWPLIAQEVGDTPQVQMHSDNLAYVIYTSGSTGTPKGAQNVHRSIVNLVNSMRRRVGITAEDNILAITTLSFDPSVWEIFLPLTSGCQLTVAPREAMVDGALLQRIIDEGGVTFMRSTPTGWRLLLESGWRGGDDLKILSGGEVLTLDLARKLQERSAILWQTYGPAEAAVFCTMGIIPRDVAQITIGRPHDNIQIYILDENMQPVAVGALGEIYIGGEGVGRGYLNRPELTAEKFVPNRFAENGHQPQTYLYRTGDLARFLADGQILFAGRNDTQVKIHGRRIELGDVEAAIGRHPAISQNVVLAREDTPGDLRLVAYLIPEPSRKVPDGRELRQFLRQILPEYMIPVRYVVLDKFPVSPNGKLDRRQLPAPDRFAEELSREYVAPQNEVQAQLAVLFAEILALDRVSIEDSFFELGGNSLLAARLLYRVGDQFQVKVQMRDFLAHPDVAEFSQVIAGREKRPAEPTREGQTKPAGRSDQSRDLLAQSNLTRGQFLMWMGQQMNPDVPLYNVVHSYLIEGQIDVGAFQEAFQALVDQNDALRTVIVEVNGVPQQKSVEHLKAVVPLIDYSQAADPQSAYQEFVQERKRQRLPLDKQPFDTALVKLAGNRYAWYFCQHHMLTDAVSSELTLERLSQYYQLALDRRLADIPQPPQYADFIRFERDFRQTVEYQEAVAYWQAKYGEALEPTEFYGKSQAGPSLHTTRVVQDLGPLRSAKLREIARSDSFISPSEDMALFTLFATLLFTTLHRINGRHTLRLGTPFHGRPTADALDIIGLFIEMGVMQVDIEQNETFTSLGEKVMAEILDGLTHVQPGISSADTNRAYDVVLNFIQARFNQFAGLPVRREPVHSGYIDADHKLRLQITDYDDSGHFVLLFDMKSDLFSETERDWFVTQFLQVVEAFIADQESSLGSFSLINEAQRERLLVEFNDTDAPYAVQKTVVQLFEEQVAKTPQAAAVHADGQNFSYEALNREANHLAAYLQEQGVGTETAVAVCMERSFEVLVAIWGVLKAGGAYIPIDPTYPPERIAYMLADAQPAMLLLANDELPSGLDLPPAVKAANLTALNLSGYSSANPQPKAAPHNLVYIIYTSGSTGRPKGTLLEHRGLQNYVCWAREVYQAEGPLAFPFYSSLAFDLTVTSIFVPLISGGQVVVYRELPEAPGMEILSVFEDNAVDIVKLTPAHLGLVREMKPGSSRIRKLIVGGEDFKTDLARSIDDLFGGEVEIFNEYGPTEAVVGCMIHRFDPLQDTAVSVPIGRPAANARTYLLDEYDQPVPPGVVGEMVISSDGVARGYLNQPELTAERFADDPLRPGARIYRSGDAARWNEAGQMVFLGRRDHQVKIGGARVELGEIESRLASHSAIHDVVVSVVQFEPRIEESDVIHCTICGLPSNYPNVTFNDDGVCNLCVDFDTFRDDVFQYFKTMDDLQAIVTRAKAESRGEYDCLMLYSGGKDSTYVLSQLVEIGLRVLAFSLDNGYISEEAKENVRQVTDHLGVDLVFATTPHMNAIFADSLERFSNVCQGCYKVIYTLSMNLARKKGIKYIFTGLSRGQLFETRLDDLFRHRIFDVQQMDTAVLEARKVYHRVDDAVSRLLDVRLFADDRVFEEIQFVDFFRYTDVELDDLYDFLSTRVPWIRPKDTGRSTNCLINEAGIYVHRTEQGYHNYALPYSWDVRLGHKTREEAMEELDDDLRLPLVQQMLDEVGYSVKDWRADPSDRRLAAYYVTDDESISVGALREYLAQRLPPYMVPSYFVRLEALPLTANGKIKRQDLPNPLEKRPEIDAAYVPPLSTLEIQLAALWSATLNVERIGIHDNFFDLGGASIPAVQIVAKISDQFEVAFPVSSFFEHPTIAGQSAILEDLLLAQVESLTDEEVAALLAELDE